MKNKKKINYLIKVLIIYETNRWKYNIGNKQCFSSRNSDNDINKLKIKLITQQKTIINNKTNKDKKSTSINKVNELIRSSNFNINNFDKKIITSAIEECQNYVQNMSKGLNEELNINKTNNNNNNINDIFKKGLQK